MSSHLVSSDPNDTGFNLAVPIDQVPVAIPAGTLTGSFVAPPLYVQHMVDMNFQVTTSGSMTGDIEVWQSNDPDQMYMQGSAAPYGIVNWTQIPVTVGVTGQASVAINLWEQAMKWLQFRWTDGGSDSGTIDVHFSAKGH